MQVDNSHYVYVSNSNPSTYVRKRYYIFSASNIFRVHSKATGNTQVMSQHITTRVKRVTTATGIINGIAKTYLHHLGYC